MEVLLKKTKISRSILSQTLRATEDDIRQSEILGWCLYRKLKFFVCYREDKNSLSMFPIFKDLVFEDRNKNQHGFDNYAVKVVIGGNYTPIVYVSATEKEREVFCSLLRVSKQRAENAGQFFL